MEQPETVNWKIIYIYSIDEFMMEAQERNWCYTFVLLFLLKGDAPAIEYYITTTCPHEQLDIFLTRNYWFCYLALIYMYM